jgi:abhydrolase domain-containing protein 5
VSLNEKSKKTPLVLVHGFAAGVALWALNFDALAAHRPVYAMDLLGFGRSSRPSFSSNAAEAESQLVESLEAWRREMLIDEMVLLGHSMGGFLAASYAIRHPERVRHLILADPWGFPERPSDEQLMNKLPFWARAIAAMVAPFNALATIRVAGPWGPNLVKRARPDLAKKFAPLVSSRYGRL